MEECFDTSCVKSHIVFQNNTKFHKLTPNDTVTDAKGGNKDALTQAQSWYSSTDIYTGMEIANMLSQDKANATITSLPVLKKRRRCAHIRRNTHHEVLRDATDAEVDALARGTAYIFNIHKY